MGRRFPFLQNLGNTLHVDDALAVHLEERVIRNRRRQFRAPVALEDAVLRFAVERQRLDQLADEAGQVRFQVRGVLAPDALLGDEREVIADEHARAETDRIGKLLSWLLRRPTVSS